MRIEFYLSERSIICNHREINIKYLEKTEIKVVNLNTFTEQKKSEIEWFRKFSPGIVLPESVDPLKTKFQLMKELKARTLKELDNSVTLLWPLNQSFPGKKVSFDYQRQNLKIESKSDLEIFYPNLKTNISSYGHFTSSGQAATFGLSLALKNQLKDFSINLLAPSVYFETRHIFDALKIPSSVDAENLYLDSSALTNAPLFYLKDKTFKRLIVDTTNWDISSAYIQKIITLAEVEKFELFLIRSHIKLDSLGAEYGTLGSIVRVSSMPDEEWNKQLQETLSYSGLLANLEQIYPFLWDKSFLDLTTTRTESIRSNTKFLELKIDCFLKKRKKVMKLRTFDHALYLLITMPAISKIHAEKFIKLSLMHQVPAKYCNSFGFDFVSLSNFIMTNDKTNEISLRICPGADTEKIEDAFEFIKDYIEVLDEAGI